jgi:ABC-type bacteriocin/lantibiotic exporter with double-glycine peptidase domain
MYLVRRMTVNTVVLVFLSAGFTLALTLRLSDSEANRAFEARERGGEYLGTTGVVMQSGSYDCGPATLSMVLEWFGTFLPPKEPKGRHRDSDGPWSMLDLQSLAEGCGLQAVGWKMQPGELLKSPRPMILFIENNHFVVFDSVDAMGAVYIRDPAIGRMKIRVHALARIWKGEALVFGERKSDNR